MHRGAVRLREGPIRGSAWPALRVPKSALVSGPTVWNPPRYGPFPTPRRVYGVRVAGQVLELQTAFYGNSKKVTVPRGRVTSFSGKSRRRLFRYCASLPWEALGQGFFVTLTYPGEFPVDGRIVKANLRAFHEAWARRIGNRQGVWKLEFQERGAPHVHLALFGGGDVARHREWAAETWYRIVGSGDPKHRTAGVQLDVLRKNPAAYFAGYVGASKGSKEYQHAVPEGFDNVGRFWGAWGLSPEWRAEVLTEREFVQLRRLVRAWSKSKKRTAGRAGRVQGEWTHTRDTSALLLAAQLSRALDRPLTFDRDP